MGIFLTLDNIRKQLILIRPVVRPTFNFIELRGDTRWCLNQCFYACKNQNDTKNTILKGSASLQRHAEHFAVQGWVQKVAGGETWNKR